MRRTCLFSLALWFVTATGLAQDLNVGTAAGKQEAGVHFRQGVELFREGAFRAALVELQRAQELFPDYRTLFNIGQTQLQLGEYVEAIKAFESYLAQGGSAIDAERRQDTENSLAVLKKRVARLAVSVNAEAAEIYVDSSMVGKSPLGATVPVSVGRHRVFAQGADGSTASEVIDVAGGDLREVHLELVAKPPEAPVIALQPSQLPLRESRPLSARKRWAITLLASGAAVGVGAGVFGFLAKQAHTDYERELDARPGSKSRIDAARNDMRLRGYVADGLLGGALALGLSSVVLFAIGDNEKAPKRAAKVELSIMPQGLLARGTF